MCFGFLWICLCPNLFYFLRLAAAASRANHDMRRNQNCRKSISVRFAAAASRKKIEKVGGLKNENSPDVCSWPCCARQLGAKAPSPPRARGGAPLILGATFLGSYGDWLWGLVSLRIHASPSTLWSVLPTSLGTAWICHKLGNAPVLRSGTGSWVLSG